MMRKVRTYLNGHPGSSKFIQIGFNEEEQIDRVPTHKDSKKANKSYRRRAFMEWIVFSAIMVWIVGGALYLIFR